MAIAFAVIAVASATLVVLGWMALVGRLAPNACSGIRTPYTRRDPENWYRTHRAAAPLLIFGGVAALMGALAFLPFAMADAIPSGLGVAMSLILAAIVLISVVAGWIYGTAAARRRE